MLVDALMGMLLGTAICGTLALRVLFGPGEEEAAERMHAPHLSTEVTMQRIFHRDAEFLYRKGGRIYTDVWHPASSSVKGIVVLLHGLDTHGGRQATFFQDLLHDGWILATCDFRGFGRSSGRHGFIASIAALADDTVAFLHHLKARFPHHRLFLSGSSMGGLTAVHTALQVQSLTDPLVAGVLLQAPALHIHVDARPPWLVEQIGRVLHAIGPKLPLLPNDDHVPSAVDGAKLALPEEDDVLYYTGRIRIGTGLALLAGIDAATPHLHNLTLPLLIQHGQDDTIVSIDASRHVHAVASSTDKTLVEYAQGGHLLWAEPPSIAKPFVADMLAWLNQHVK
ncbi:Aste57867_24480 [Aphanomyces stellatus]|uniref:Aste57867_24480 protein n=1 Tax=Aphanomyces stellatus TaxID=120398 RepID=A0A485LUU6_9STRA|nr:hypothetical protein As57867_024403 [Aphanomyces stellatus]VFU01119.1 Aste57867_24480 [Aphanomyces stellatus]